MVRMFSNLCMPVCLVISKSSVPCLYAKLLQLCQTLCNLDAHQAPLSMGFSRQEYRSGLPFPTPGDLPDLGIEPMSHCVSSIGRWVLYHYCHLRYPDFTQILLVFSKNRNLDPSSVSSAWECVMSLQSCLTLRNPVDCSPPGSSVHRILQARILEWVTVPSSRGSSWE